VIWLFIVLSAVSVFLIAALTIGREARRLDALAPRAVYQLEQATDFVAQSLSESTQARVTMEELEQLLVLHMNWLHAKGLLPDRAVDHRQDQETAVVVSDDSLIGFLLGKVEELGIDLVDDMDIVSIAQAHLAYFDAIGAIGPLASEAGA
jgi:hypothetical protein